MSKSFNLKAIITAVDRVSGPLGRINGKIGAFGRGLRGLKTPIMLLAGTALAGISKAVGDFVRAGSAINDMSERLGVSAEQLQEYDYIAGQSGVSTDTLHGSMEKLNKSIYGAASGKNKEAAALFSRMGINLKDSNGHMRTAADIMPDLADAFKANQDPVLRTAMATALMGKSGGELIPMLTGGSKAMRVQIEMARKLGGIMSNDAVKAADQLGDKWDTLKLAGQGFAFSMAARLAPALNMVADAFIRVMSGTGPFLQLGPEMRQTVDGLFASFSGLVEAGKNLWNSLSPIFGPLFELIGGAAMQAVIAQWTVLAKILKGVVDIISLSAGGLVQLIGAFAPSGSALDEQAQLARERNSKIVQSYRNTNTVSGSLDVNFKNAPAGTRVAAPVASPGLAINPNVGYSTRASGAW